MLYQYREGLHRDQANTHHRQKKVTAASKTHLPVPELNIVNHRGIGQKAMHRIEEICNALNVGSLATHSRYVGQVPDVQNMDPIINTLIAQICTSREIGIGQSLQAQVDIRTVGLKHHPILEDSLQVQVDIHTIGQVKGMDIGLDR